MKTGILMSACLIGSLIAITEPASAAEANSTPQDVTLSPDLLNLLRAEMREISGGVQGMALAIATGDWRSIQATSAKIRASYILDRKLTAAQATELTTALPERFKTLDAEFHHRAGQIGAAAAARDAELVVFHYSRLLEGCTACHSGFAKSRFPAFSPAVTEPEHHH